MVCSVRSARSWLTGRGALAAARCTDRALLEDLEGSLLAALLLALQRLPPLLNGAARSEPRAALRTALAQVQPGLQTMQCLLWTRNCVAPLCF